MLRNDLFKIKWAKDFAPPALVNRAFGYKHFAPLGLV